MKLKQLMNGFPIQLLKKLPMLSCLLLAGCVPGGTVFFGAQSQAGELDFNGEWLLQGLDKKDQVVFARHQGTRVWAITLNGGGHVPAGKPSFDLELSSDPVGCRFQVAEQVSGALSWLPCRLKVLSPNEMKLKVKQADKNLLLKRVESYELQSSSDLDSKGKKLDLSGKWRGDYGVPYFEEKIEIRQKENRIIALKLTGDDNIPAGERTFIATLDGKDNPGKGYLADEGYQNVKAFPGHLLIHTPGHIEFVWQGITRVHFFRD